MVLDHMIDLTQRNQLVSKIYHILINNYFNLHFSSQGDIPRFSNLSQSKGKYLETPKVQKRPNISNPVYNEEFQIDDETKSQIQNNEMFHQKVLMDIGQEVANQEGLISQIITSNNMMNSAINLGDIFYDVVDDI